MKSHSTSKFANKNMRTLAGGFSLSLTRNGMPSKAENRDPTAK